MTERERAHDILERFTDMQIKGFLLMFEEYYFEPNEETLEAFREVEEMKKHPENYKRYSSVEELFADLEKEE